MMPRAPVLLFSRDEVLRRRVEAYLLRMAEVTVFTEAAAFLSAARQGDAPVAVVDLRDPALREHLSQLVPACPRCALIALGEARSEPLRAAAEAGFYACEALPGDGIRLQDLVRRATQYVQACQENEQLRQDLQRARATPAPPPPPAAAAPWRQLSHVLRQFERPDDLYAALIEHVAVSASVTRAGIFLRAAGESDFRLRGGHRCPASVAQRRFAPDDPFVRWFTRHDHLVARSTLEHVEEPNARRSAERMLEACGAEVLLPLRARGDLMGWLFVGHRITGAPFREADLAALYDLADHVATVLENAALYEEVAVQKALAESLLHSMPSGLVAVGPDGQVRWFNEAAQRVLNLAADDVVGQSVKVLGSRLADVLHRVLAGDPNSTNEWTDARTRRFLSVHTQRLTRGDSCLGAFAVIEDLTAQRSLEEKEEQLERAQFWADLAAGMSHEIRNPLVAIKTFAQLLPERFEDADFRSEFSRLVNHEVDRLNGIIEQINTFAHPPAGRRQQLAARTLLDRALALARERVPFGDTVVDVVASDNLPDLQGDPVTLADALAHLVVNAVEAVAARPGAYIMVQALAAAGGTAESTMQISVRDNGPGMPPEAREKAFSPFFTTKARGMGLGLAVARRAMVDHGGEIHIDSSPGGTTVSLRLPTTPHAADIKEVSHEAHSGRG